MKVLHFADFHLGISSDGRVDTKTMLNERVLDYLDSLDSLIEYAKENNADIALFAGDAFNKPNPEMSYIREFGDRIIKLAEICPVVLLVGNHDMPGIIEKASPIDLFGVMRVPNVYVGWTYEVLKIATESGDIQIATVPYPTRRQLLPRGSREELKDVVHNIIKGLAKEIDTSIPSVLLGHFTVEGSVYKPDMSVMSDKDAEVDKEDLLKPWDYVALGHLHLHQCINDYPPIVYAGSLDRVTFNDEKDNKGFVWVDINGEVNWEFIQVDARSYKTLKFDFIKHPNKRPTDVIINKIQDKDLNGAIVRVLINIEEEHAVRIDVSHIGDALKSAGVFYVNQIHVNRVKAQSSIRLSDVPVATIPKIDLVDLYFQDIGVKNKDKSALLSLAKEIMGDVDASLV